MSHTPVGAVYCRTCTIPLILDLKGRTLSLREGMERRPGKKGQRCFNGECPIHYVRCELSHGYS